jgi:hypothetical protein
MAFADPQSVTVDGTAIDLPRTGQSLQEGTFRSADREYELSIKHSDGSRYRHLAQLKDNAVVANPLVPDQNVAISMHAHLVIDAPRNGFSATEIAALATAIVDWATPTNIAALVAGEN